MTSSVYDAAMSATPDFHHLTPDLVIDTVEKALGRRLANLCRPLNSYINRVYELADEENEEGLVAKFFRPGRWDEATLMDEQLYLQDLAANDIPVIAPLPLQDGGTLGNDGKTFFVVFPKKGGRNNDEFSDEEWVALGRLMGRIHAVGATRNADHRVTMTPASLTNEQVDWLCESTSMDEDIWDQYVAVTDELLDLIEPEFERCELQRIHGDCHFNNIIYRPGDSFYMIDFDDMAMGPVVQDLWMLLPGRVNDCLVEIDCFMEGYEMFKPFPRWQLRLIEALRAMRYIHYSAWCAKQAADGGFQRLAPGWGERSYWKGEIRDLREQIVHIRKALASGPSGGNW